MPGLAVTLHSPLYFGGLPASVRVSAESAASLASYTGCLGDVTLNNVFVNFADATERPNAQLEQCPLQTAVAGERGGREGEGRRGDRKRELDREKQKGKGKEREGERERERERE